MDLSLKMGGDETSFLFNLTQNLRFEPTKVKENDGSGEVPIYTSTVQGYLGSSDEEQQESSDSSDNDISADA